MSFIWPSMFWLFLAIPLLIAAYIFTQRRRKKYAARYASLSLVKDAMGKGPGFRRHIPPILFLLGMAIMIFALTRPQAVVTVPSQEGTVILTIDVSGSMMATDVQPSRMEAAKAAAREFVQDTPATMQIGVVSYSDNASIVQAPTADKSAVLAAINRLTPQRATAIGRGLLTSLDAIFINPEANAEGGGGFSRQSAFQTPTPTPSPTPVPKGQYAPAIVILLSDGENNQFPAPLDIINQVVDRGIRVFTVGVGSPEGTVLHIQGRSIRTRLDEQTLKSIADMTDGQYFNATTASDLQAVYQKLSTQLVFKAQEIEVTAGFTAAAGALMLLAGALSLFWFNRLP